MNPQNGNTWKTRHAMNFATQRSLLKHGANGMRVVGGASASVGRICNPAARELCISVRIGSPRSRHSRVMLASLSAGLQIRPTFRHTYADLTRALSSRAERSGVEGSRELATTPDVLGNSRDPSTPLRSARDDRAGLRFSCRVVQVAARHGALPTGKSKSSPTLSPTHSRESRSLQEDA